MNARIQKEIQERLAKLLAESSLNSQIKKVLLDKIGDIPDYHLFDLIDALETEKIELEKIALNVKLFLEQQDSDWKKVEEQQQAVGDEMINKELKKLEDEFNLEQARTSLQSEWVSNIDSNGRLRVSQILLASLRAKIWEPSRPTLLEPSTLWKILLT